MALKAPLLTAATLALVLGLSACGSTAQDPLLAVGRGLATAVFNREDPAPAIDPRQVLTRDIITQAGLPLILVESLNGGGASTMVRIATNGTNETWQGDGDGTVTLSREGVLRTTRGYGADLYAADIEGTRAALANRRAGSLGRLFVRVEGDLQQVQAGYSCTLGFSGTEQITIFGQSRNLTRATETCSLHPGIPAPGANPNSFENRYWIDSTGFAWVSEQWAGPDLGHFRIERLFR